MVTELAISKEMVVYHACQTYFMTITPCLVAASTSTLSTPVPARPIIFRLLAALMMSAVTFVEDLTTSPS